MKKKPRWAYKSPTVSLENNEVTNTKSANKITRTHRKNNNTILYLIPLHPRDLERETTDLAIHNQEHPGLLQAFSSGSEWVQWRIFAKPDNTTFCGIPEIGTRCADLGTSMCNRPRLKHHCLQRTHLPTRFQRQWTNQAKHWWRRPQAKESLIASWSTLFINLQSVIIEVPSPIRLKTSAESDGRVLSTQASQQAGHRGCTEKAVEARRSFKFKRSTDWN